jgi:hypothetical protein
MLTFSRIAGSPCTSDDTWEKDVESVGIGEDALVLAKSKAKNRRKR